MGMVRKYLSRTIERERVEIQQDLEHIDGYAADTDFKKQEMRDLQEKPTTFQPNRCSACGTSLELPVVHFLCKHSFHHRCLLNPDDSSECPACSPTNAAIRALRQAQEDTASRHDLFNRELAISETNRFATIINYFGRGVMRN